MGFLEVGFELVGKKVWSSKHWKGPNQKILELDLVFWKWVCKKLKSSSKMEKSVHNLKKSNLKSSKYWSKRPRNLQKVPQNLKNLSNLLKILPRPWFLKSRAKNNTIIKKCSFKNSQTPHTHSQHPLIYTQDTEIDFFLTLLKTPTNPSLIADTTLIQTSDKELLV